MEQKMRFGLVGNTEKKMGADYEKLLRVVFFMFSGAKKSFNLKKKNVMSKKKVA